MSPDVTAQIIAKAWSDEAFAQALKGPDAYAAIQETLGVSLPAGTPLPEIPEAPVGLLEVMGVGSAVRAGQAFPQFFHFSTIDSYLKDQGKCMRMAAPMLTN